jgi:hypothetical protein
MSGSKKKLRADKLTPITVATDNPAAANPEADSSSKSASSVQKPSRSSGTTSKQA